MSLIDDARQAAIKYGINPDTFVRQIQQESGFNPNARSPAGAEGIAQFMPSTARGLGINPFNPVQALNAAAQYMARSLRAYGGNYAKALAAYNAGGGAVNYAIARGGKNWQQYLPAETQNYIRIIMGSPGQTTLTRNSPYPHASSTLVPPGLHPSITTPQHAAAGRGPVPAVTPPAPKPVFGTPFTISVPPQPSIPASKTIFGTPFTLAIPRQPSVPVQKPKPSRPQPTPKPVAAPMTATQKKSLLAGKRQVRGPF